MYSPRLLLELIITFTMSMLVASVVISSSVTAPIVRPGCRNSCENSTVKIPFPFGIGTGCYHDPWYEIVCNSSSPFLRKFNLEVLNISSCLSTTEYDLYSKPTCSYSDLHLEVATQWQNICTAANTSLTFVTSLDLTDSPFYYSMEYDVFVMAGCPAHAAVINKTGDIVGGCSSVCPGGEGDADPDPISIPNNTSHTCDGLGCCLIQATDSDFYKIRFPNCMKVALMEASSQPKIIERLSSTSPFPTVWHWNPPELPTPTLNNHSDNIFCTPYCNFKGCSNICQCQFPYVGNPYLPYGCQDFCDVGEKHLAIRCKKSGFPWMKVLELNVGLLCLFLFFYGMYHWMKRWIELKQRAHCFRKNGGLLLQQKMTSGYGAIERTKIFTASELNKATDNFNVNRVLGQGGQGTVYKGMLLDGRVVAIKKSKKVESQSKHFINEVVILSQINHRNVVKLLGCCLETEVPLLVYEFIPNGTLGQHIHNNNHTEDLHITWDMRLRIAQEAAAALAYLHSASAPTIYHRDVKSSNILLDDMYRAKVADFGTSRTLTIDKTHLTTCVHGTFGYLDPEYFQSNKFTDKSDVYSFGVVLVELLTSQKSLYLTESDGWKSLAMEFLLHVEESHLFDIVDKQILKDADEDELVAMANLAKSCLNLNGKLRPTMKEVASTLEGIKSANLASAQEQIYPEENIVVTEISMRYGDATPSTWFSDYNIGASNSFEIQSATQLKTL